ncbi:tRNA pseudouridine(55) synthase TruB [bacterium]|nr:tRNA pseudouridine(55) synthase TruB [bacterium]MBU1072264.1 tRNA pseudouridine(55) synthase TruB [bacterium]MBU1676060.1 tRNA pseudouridine(55) synthase TruB [bacterium]
MAAPHRGFLLIDKPRGVSSHGVVETVRRVLAPGTRRRGAGRFRCGHAGTLDPLATGLLLILCGPETRLSRFLLGHDKRYRFTLRLGVSTDTLDADGEEVATGGADYCAADVAAALDAFRGESQQVPPVISALKRGGRPMYALARGGGDVPELAGRPVRIHDIGVCGEARRRAARHGEVCDVDLSVHCASGTYIRSLARDIAAALGTVGHVFELRRTAIGPFEVAEALGAARMHDAEALAGALRPAVVALPEMPALAVTAAEAAALRQGIQPETAWLARLPEPPVAWPSGMGEFFRMVDAAGDLVAVGELAHPSDGANGGPVPPRIAAVFPPQPGESERDRGSCD